MLLARPVMFLLTLAVLVHLPVRAVVWVVGVAVVGSLMKEVLLLSLILRLPMLALRSIRRELAMLMLVEEVLLWIDVVVLVRPVVLFSTLEVMVELLVLVLVWVVRVVV